MQASSAPAGHLRSLLDDLRTLSQIDRGQLALNVQRYNVNILVQRVFDTYEPVALDKQQSFTHLIAPDLPEVLIDPRQIERVLVNLVSNAINYTTSHKAITIETLSEEQSVVIRVVDQGIGISSEDLTHIFDRFYRTAEARENLSTGTGLGLAITKEIVEMHNGSIIVITEQGKGSTFIVHLPLHP
jgi:signal transduction histidine kinase